MYVMGAVLIAGFGVLGVLEMIKAQTPYLTTVAQAKAITDRPMQLVGSIVREKTTYDNKTDELVFQLRDRKGQTLTVRYKGVKPGNFDTADKAVVRGSIVGGEFIAGQVLLKCPSKYQGK
jgi:cytochrome c-type biogenesis protein CcmE